MPKTPTQTLKPPARADGLFSRKKPPASASTGQTVDVREAAVEGEAPQDETANKRTNASTNSPANSTTNNGRGSRPRTLTPSRSVAVPINYTFTIDGQDKAIVQENISKSNPARSYLLTALAATTADIPAAIEKQKQRIGDFEVGVRTRPSTVPWGLRLLKADGDRIAELAAAAGARGPSDYVRTALRIYHEGTNPE